MGRYNPENKTNTGTSTGGRWVNTQKPKEPSKLSKVIKGVGNFAQDVATDAAGTLLIKPAQRATEAITRLVAPNSQAAKGYEILAAEGKGQNIKLPGLKNYNVSSVKGWGQGGGKQIAGEALETASWLIGGGEAKTASTIFKQGAKQFAKSQGGKLLAEGAVIGLTGSLGSQLTEGDQKVSLGKTALETGLSTVLTPVAAFGLNRLFGKKLPEVLRSKNLDNLLKNDKWAVVTATREKVGSFDHPFNVEANKRLESELVSRYGKENVVKVEGKYNNVNKGDSYFVNGIDEASARMYGKKYGQDTVLTKKGFVASDGSFYEPAMGMSKGEAALKQPGYTTLPNGETIAMEIGNKIETPAAAIPMPGKVMKPKPITTPKVSLIGGELRASRFKTKEEFIGNELQFLQRTKQKIPSNFQQKTGELYDRAWSKISGESPIQSVTKQPNPNLTNKGLNGTQITDNAYNAPGEIKIPDKGEPLITEAKKYKSAEEFVKAQGQTLYHGGGKFDKNLIKEDGISLTDYKTNAEGFAKYENKRGIVNELVLEKNAKIMPYKDIPSNMYYFDDRQGINVALDYNDIVNYAKSKGFDGVDMIPLGENEIRVWNPEVIKTKSQLIDIWNKAQEKIERNPELAKQTEEIAQVFAKQDELTPELRLGDLKTRSENFIKAYAENPLKMERVAMGLERDALIPQEDALGALSKIASDNGDWRMIKRLESSNVGSQAASNFNGLKLAGENNIVKVIRDLRLSIEKKFPNAFKKSQKETQDAMTTLKKYFKENNIPEREFNNIMDEFTC